MAGIFVCVLLLPHQQQIRSSTSAARGDFGNETEIRAMWVMNSKRVDARGQGVLRPSSKMEETSYRRIVTCVEI